MALKGIKVIEMAGLAPAPFCGMILSDFGANVVRVDKVKQPVTLDVLGRGKRSIALDLKQQQGVTILKNMCKTADVLIDSFRPGVMEKFGVGPRDLEPLNPGLIYARLTGYGQYGPMSAEAGHDINYLALSGVLSRLGRSGEKPHAPVNLLADFAGGGLTCALGIMMALYHRTTTGTGQVVDCSMVEGSAYVGTWLWRSRHLFTWSNPKGQNWLDGGAPFYDTYQTKDGKYISVGTVEPEFFNNFIKAIGLGDADGGVDMSVGEPECGDLRDRLSQIFLTRTRDEWCEVFAGTDSCVAPVLDLEEAETHEHNADRGTFVTGQGGPRPAPRLSLTPGRAAQGPEPLVGEHSREVVRELGLYTDGGIDTLIQDGVIEHRERADGDGANTDIEKQWSKL